MEPLKIVEHSTKPYEGQKPGTSGLRKRTKVFMEENYVENFVQATFDAVGQDTLKGSTMVVGGDGRYFNQDIIQTIIAMAAANSVTEVVVGQNGLFSTPAVSAMIRRYNGGSPIGGFILTASHNPGGIDEDCGIKYNVRNGGPAPESVTNLIYENTKTISKFLKAELPGGNPVDLSKPGKHELSKDFRVTVVSSTEAYVELMKEVFDFKLLQSFLSTGSFKFMFDGMNGVAGPYAKAIFVDELGISAESLVNCEPLEDFGKGHPDPNLTYAKELVQAMGLDRKGNKLSVDAKETQQIPDMGAACDGDADRNMVLGKQFFVTPSDSVAILAAYAEKCIPFFASNGGLKAVARSMPTSAALDRVAERHGIPLFEVPTGWKFFGNLMDAVDLTSNRSEAEKLNCNPLICGEESFGTGSDHVREKDGIWAVLCWLSVLAYRNKDRDPKSDQFVSIEQIVKEHWTDYGRNYYCRYDYENVESERANAMMTALTELIQKLKDGKVSKLLNDSMPEWEIAECDEFEYHDPVDKSISSHQGWRFMFTNGSRFVFRLSGTGSVGATIRLYLEKFDEKNVNMNVEEALKTLVELALDVSKIEEFTGRSSPTVIT